MIYTFVIGVVLGYWLYPARMFWKLHKINKLLTEVELQHMKMKEQLEGKQWNEDNL